MRREYIALPLLLLVAAVSYTVGFIIFTTVNTYEIAQEAYHNGRYGNN